MPDNPTSQRELPHTAPTPIDIPTPEEVAEIEAEGRRGRSLRAIGLLVFGTLLSLCGLAVSAASYAAASTAGGSYVVWYGPIGGGAILILLGICDLLNEAEGREKKQYEDLMRIR